MESNSAGPTLDEIVGPYDDVDSEVEILIKSEFHFSKRDWEEEYDLIQTGEFETVVFELPQEGLEGIEEKSLIDRIIGVPFFFFRPLYTNSTPLILSAFRQGATPKYTRESDADVINELPTPFPTLSVTIWTLLLLFTILLGVPEGTLFRISGFEFSYMQISLFSFVGVIGLPITIRKIRGWTQSDVNRNRIMAKRITSAHSDSEKTLVILGSDHSEEVQNQLPAEIESNIIPSSGLFNIYEMVRFLPRFAVTVSLVVGIWVIIERVGGFLLLVLFFLLS